MAGLGVLLPTTSMPAVAALDGSCKTSPKQEREAAAPILKSIHELTVRQACNASVKVTYSTVPACGIAKGPATLSATAVYVVWIGLAYSLSYCQLFSSVTCTHN